MSRLRSTPSEHINVLNGNHEYHGRVISWEFSYSFGHFFYVDDKDCSETVWGQENNHPNNDYPVEIRNCFEIRKWCPKTEKCGRLSKTSAMKNRYVPTPSFIAEGNQISLFIELLLENRTQAVCYHICICYHIYCAVLLYIPQWMAKFSSMTHHFDRYL